MMKARYRKIQAQILAKQELDARKVAKQKQKEEKAEYMQKLKQ